MHVYVTLRKTYLQVNVYINIETKQLGIDENSFPTKIFAILMICAMGLGVAFFIYNHHTGKRSNEISSLNLKNDNMQYELLNAVSDNALVTEI